VKEVSAIPFNVVFKPCTSNAPPETTTTFNFSKMALESSLISIPKTFVMTISLVFGRSNVTLTTPGDFPDKVVPDKDAMEESVD